MRTGVSCKSVGNEPMRPATVGTLDWATRTGGRLSLRDRLRLVAQALLIESRSWPDRFLRRLDVGRDRLAKIDLDQLRIPDSLACRDAERLCAEQTPPVVLVHSQRSYVWGTILAAHDRISFDEELLWIASLLHDLGFVRSRRHRQARMLHPRRRPRRDGYRQRGVGRRAPPVGGRSHHPAPQSARRPQPRAGGPPVVGRHAP